MIRTFQRVAFAAALAILCVHAARADTYLDRTGTVVQPSVTLPYPYVPVGPGQYNVTISSSTGLTIPKGAIYATACAQTAAINYTTDGLTTPTASVGNVIATGTCISLSAKMMANFLAISASGKLNVEFFQ